MLHLVIVDDNKSIKSNLTQIFSLFDDIEILATYADGDEVLNGLKSLPKLPDIILMDIEMQRMNGIKATHLVKHEFPDITVVMLTVSEDNNHIAEALNAGADGYLLKGEKPLKMVELLHLAKEGRFPMSPNVAMSAVKMMMSNKPEQSFKKPEDFGITAREHEVLKQIVAGRNYNQIAEILFISPQTVRTHTDNIYRKLNVHSKVEASKLAIENKWV